MEIKLLSCPLCTESHFQNIIVLRNALIDVTKKPLTCPVCEEVLVGLDKFTIHLFTHCNIINEQDSHNHLEKTVSNNDNNNNENNECLSLNDNLIAVNNCPQEYTQVENLQNNTTSAKDVHCEICNFDFSDSNLLEMHRSLLHSNGFSCHLCQKKFKMHGSLMVHMRVAHYGFKNKLIPAQDNEDKNLFHPSTSLSENENITPTKSVDNKQWQCDVCLKKFTTKYFLKKHKRLHTGEMPYECTLCNKSFTFQQSYHKHMLYHSADKPHTCSECGRAFKELSTLHNHQRIHSGERPFGCETCGKQFRQRVSYLVHKRIHTGAMPYKCTSCDKSFRYKVSQRTHKCKAQPPGSVVRQFGDLVQKLLQNRPPEETIPNTASCATPSTTPSTSDGNDKSMESCQSCPEVNTDFFGLVMSPTFQITSDQFESLCLSSKENDNNADEIFNNLRPETSSSLSNIPRQECSTINEECFKQLLYNNPD